MSIVGPYWRHLDKLIAAVGTNAALEDFARQINIHTEAAEAGVHGSVNHALVAGQLLAKAKATVTHGTWADWLDHHCTVTPTSACGYMRVARSWSLLLDQQGAAIATLTLRDVLNLVARGQPAWVPLRKNKSRA